MSTPHAWEDVIGPEERLIATNYAAPRQIGQRPALLMIDLYKKVFGDRREPLEEAITRFPATCGPPAWDALGPLEGVLATARANGVPVAHTTGEQRPESGLGGATLRRRDHPGERHDGGYEIVDQLKPQPGEFVAYKSRASAMFGTTLGTWLQLRGVDTLVVAGESTSGCVRASVVDAFSHGYRVIVVEQATFDRSPLSHKVNLFDMHHKYATVAHLDQVLAYLSTRDPAAVGGVPAGG